MLFGGAAGGGKSYVSAAILIMLHKFYPGSRSHIVRESLPTLKRTTIPTFFKLCPKRFIRSYNQTDQIVTFQNGSQLTFFPENFFQDKNLTRFDGLETNWFLLEEGQELQKKTFEKCKLRVGRHIIPGMDDQPKPMILSTCNPSQNWTKDVFHTPAKEGRLPADFYYLQALMKDNTSLPKEYLEGLVNLDEITRAVFVEGDWDVLDVQRPYAYSFRPKKTVVDHLDFDFRDPVILSFDFNVDPITCLAIQGDRDEERIRVIREFRLENSDIYELCLHIRAAFPTDVIFMVTGDSTGNNRHALSRGNLNFYQVIQNELDIPTNAFKVPTFNPGHKAARTLVNSLLERHPDLLISKDCKWLINDLKMVEVDREGEMVKDRKNENKKADLLDGLIYYFWTFHHDFIHHS